MVFSSVIALAEEGVGAISMRTPVSQGWSLIDQIGIASRQTRESRSLSSPIDTTSTAGRCLVTIQVYVSCR